MAAPVPPTDPSMRHRIADATLTVLGPDGRPLADTEVVVEQTRHAFAEPVQARQRMVWISTLSEHVQQRLVLVIPVIDDTFRRFGVDEPPPRQCALCRLNPNHRARCY